jgi:hypothetical protein
MKTFFGISGFLLVLSLSALALPIKDEATEPAVDDETFDPGPSLCTGFPGNLAANCGFETGTFSSWTQSGDPSFTTVSARSTFTGNWGGEFGPTGSLGYIAQNMTTTVGQTYAVTFWLRNAGQPNQFRVFWGGTLIYSLDNTPDFAYMPISIGGLTATSASTELKFGFFNPPDWFFMDDVIVVNCPG